MRRKDTLITTAIALALAVSAGGPLGAAEEEQKQGSGQQQAAQGGQKDDKIDLVSWRQAEEYEGGWTAQQLFDTPVYGADGNDIGEIENLIISTEGKIEKIIVEAGGFIDIGDVHLAVPWSEVEVGKGLERVETPLEEDNVDDFSLFDDDGDEVETDRRSWRATELMYDYVSLEDYRGYGMVNDLVFSKDGEIEALLVNPDVGYGGGGPYAYPYHGYDRGFEPGADTYRLPYTREEISELGPFDYSVLEIPRPPRAGAPEVDEQG